MNGLIFPLLLLLLLPTRRFWRLETISAVTFLLVLLTIAGGKHLPAQDSAFHPRGEQIDLPPCAWPSDEDSGTHKPIVCNDHMVSEWLRDLTHWRDERRIRAGYSPAAHTLYDEPGMQWTQSNFIETQLMIHDRFLFVAQLHER